MSEPVTIKIDGDIFLQQALAAVYARFPLLNSIRIGTTGDREQIPPFIGMIAAIMESIAKPCCVVLPDTTGVAMAVSALIASTCLNRNADDILRSFAANSLELGDRVYVHPSGFIYEYEGFFTPQHFKLKIIGRNEKRSLSVSDVARLEKTSRKRPKGQLNSELGVPSATVLGTLMGIPGTVNRNFLRNYLLVLGSKKEFRDFSEDWTISIANSAPMLAGILGEELSFGDVIEDGTLRFFDRYITSGDPPVAVATRPEDLVSRCSQLQPRSCNVLINDVENLVRNLHAYDAISDCQNMVILAAESQHEHIRILKQRGCEIWQFSPEEVLLGMEDLITKVPLSIPLTKAANVRALVVSSVPCVQSVLDDTAANLSQCARAVPRDNDSQPVRELFITLFGALMACAEHLGMGSDTFSRHVTIRLEQAAVHLNRSNAWLTPEIRDSLSEVIEKLKTTRDALAQQSCTAKGKAVLESLVATDDRNRFRAIVTRTEAMRDEMRNWLFERGHQIPVYRVNEIPWDQDFDQILILAWPSARRFDKLLRQYSTRKLDVLTYSFENLWLRDYHRQYVRTRLSDVSRVRKSALLGFSHNPSTEEAIPLRELSEPGQYQLPEEKYLVRRKSSSAAAPAYGHNELIDAYYIDFTGSTFALISEGHSLPVVNQLMGGKEHSSSIPYRSVEDLAAGDFVLFRESGDSDIIRFIVEDEIGTGEYQRLRSIASRWKVALLRLAPDPRSAWKRLQAVGFSKHPLTVKNWMTNEQMIGPQDSGDIALIARAAEDQELLSTLAEVVNAIEEVKGHHIAAGFRLTTLLLEELPKRAEAIKNGEMEIDLGFGKVWIVQIAEIDETSTPCNRSGVNRLLWDDASY